MSKSLNVNFGVEKEKDCLTQNEKCMESRENEVDNLLRALGVRSSSHSDAVQAVLQDCSKTKHHKCTCTGKKNPTQIFEKETPLKKTKKKNAQKLVGKTMNLYNMHRNLCRTTNIIVKQVSCCHLF